MVVGDLVLFKKGKSNIGIIIGVSPFYCFGSEIKSPIYKVKWLKGDFAGCTIGYSKEYIKKVETK